MLASNDFVSLHSLKQTAEHNGQIAQVIDYVSEKDRYSVRLLGTHKVLHIKETNLTPATKEQVRQRLAELLDKVTNKQQLIDLIKTKKPKAKPSSSLADLRGQALDLQCEALPMDQTPPPSPPRAAAAAFRPAADPNVEQACRQYEQMSVSEMKKRVSQLRSATPSVLRTGNPALRNMSDADVRAAVQPEIDRLDKMLISPEAKRAILHEMRTGEVSSFTTDEELEAKAKDQLDMFKRDKLSFRRMLPPQAQALSDADVLAQLEAAANMSGADIRRLQANGGVQQVTADPATLSDEMLVNNAKMQLEMFDRDPQEFKKRIPAQQRAMMDQMGDVVVREQLKAATAMSAKELREQMQNAKAMLAGGGVSGAAGAAAAMSDPSAAMRNMSGEDVLRNIKMARDMCRRDPDQFKRMMPAQVQPMAASMSNEFMQQALDYMGDISPTRMKQIMTWMARAHDVFKWVDGKTGGRGQMVMGGAALLVVSLLLLVLLWLLWTLVGLFGRLVFGGSSAAGAKMVMPQQQQQVIPPQVDVEPDVVVDNQGADAGWDEL
jgi:hypothetical protein